MPKTLERDRSIRDYSVGTLGYMDNIDLHTHSKKGSDGAYSPTEVVWMAKEAGLSAIALTDHDNINGLDEARRAALEAGIGFVPGIEISAYNNRYSNIHVVGLFLNNLDPIYRIQQEIAAKKSAYVVEVCDRISEKIGRDFHYHSIKSKLKGSVNLGALSTVLADERLSPSWKEAFAMLKDMEKEGKIPVEKQMREHRIPVIRAIETIHQAGGVAVLAHPCRLDKKIETFPEIRPFIEPIIEQGIDAIEAFYPKQDPRYTRQVLNFANARGILISGGSDFHGQKKGSLIGRYPDGSYIMSGSYLEPLQHKARLISMQRGLDRQQGL